MKHEFIRLAVMVRRAERLNTTFQLPRMTLKRLFKLIRLLASDVDPRNSLH